MRSKYDEYSVYLRVNNNGSSSSNGNNSYIDIPIKKGPTIPPVPYEEYYLPIYIVSGIFGAIFILGPLLVKKGPNKGIIQSCILLSAFSMWLLWVTVYIAQMNPLVGPRLSNASMAWLAHRWGEPLEPAVEEPPPTEAITFPSSGTPGTLGGEDSSQPTAAPPGDNP